MSARDDRAAELFDFAAGHRKGFTYNNIAAKFGWDYGTFLGAVRRLRRILGGSSDGTLVCTPQARGERWRYELTGDWQKAAPWAHNRIGDVEARLESIDYVVTTVSRIIDGRSVDGRKARLIRKVVGRLREDLGEIALANGA
jgi:hypothetical protein